MMAGIGPQGLFLTTIGAHVLMIGFTIWRIMVNAPVPEEDKTAFQVSMPARGQTPETAALAAGEGEAEPLDMVPDPQDAETQAPDSKPYKGDPSGPAV
jgi:hypothetical protein